MPKYRFHSEEEFDYWADLFTTHGLRRYMPFAVFMRDPQRHVREILDQDYRPLLPDQQAVAANVKAGEYDVLEKACDGLETALTELEQSVEELGRNNGRYYERMKHHRVAG